MEDDDHGIRLSDSSSVVMEGKAPSNKVRGVYVKPRALLNNVERPTGL
ncbi:MAG: hypothetical protein DRJ69_04845 [Thermoprotei archaeon]|nr:MAG: hypothetical protein DRJ69_04845 [Thermoprotei archaeon]